MKKLFIFMGAVLLGVGAFGVGGKKAVRAGATPGAEVQELLRSYREGGYTKKTQMYLTDDAVDEMAEYFHAGQDTLMRATYYNADESALLMGNYDGTFGGVGGINGGFRNISTNACERFHYTDETPNVDNLFSAEHTEMDYVALEQTVGGYYQTLQSLSEAINDDWIKEGSAYKYDVSGIAVENNEYTDPVLKKFQYFAAPMLLQNAYFSWSSIRVVEGSSYLSIRLYSTKASGEGKSTVVGATEALISEARVYKGISLNPEVTWTLKGTFDTWGAGQPLVLDPDIYEPEQYSITRYFSKNDEFKINSGDYWRGYYNLENKTWFKGSDNIGIKFDGSYKVYFKPKAATQSQIYIAVPDAKTYTFTWSEEWIGNNDAKLFVCLFDELDQGSWIEIVGYSGERSVDVSFSSEAYVKVTFVRSDPSNTTGGWHKANGYWNQTEDINLVDGTVDYNTSWKDCVD